MKYSLIKSIFCFALYIGFVFTAKAQTTNPAESARSQYVNNKIPGLQYSTKIHKTAVADKETNAKESLGAQIKNGTFGGSNTMRTSTTAPAAKATATVRKSAVLASDSVLKPDSSHRKPASLLLPSQSEEKAAAQKK